MLRLDAFLRRRRTAALVIWIALFVAALPLALHQSDNLTGGGFSVPGSQSKQVEDTLQRDFGVQARAASMGAVLVPAKNATPAQIRATLDELARAADDVARVALPAKARAAALKRAEPGTPLIVPLAVATDEFGSSDVASDLREELAIKDRAAAPVGLHLIGQGALWAGLQDESKADLAAAESTGFPIVLMILLAVFGSLAAASLPLVLGVVSVLVTGAIIYLLSSVIDMNVFVTNMASMIGIGVAVDYSLFVLARYREELARGHAPDRARAIAMATSGVAVLFSGLTVVVSLAGLLFVRTSALQSMALGAILVVLVSMLASATLLPVLMRLLGKRASVRGPIIAAVARGVANRRPWRRGSTHPEAPVRASAFERLAGAVMRRPIVAALAATGVLLALAAPALDFKTGDGALRQFPDGNETRVGFEAAASVSSPGESSPIKVVVDRGEVRAARATLKGDREVLRVSRAIPAERGDRVLLRVIPRRDGEAEETKALVSRL
ncbi:MAG TPA: MMPL family transporter, partial [Solirubrobacteraceae bacterium]